MSGADFGGAPDLDHANPELREALCHWLQHLKRDIGFEGWRFDFVKVGRRQLCHGCAADAALHVI